MSAISNLKDYIKSIKPIEPEFFLSVRPGYLCVDQTAGRSLDEETDPLKALVQASLYENFDRNTLKHFIHVEETFSICMRVIHKVLLDVICTHSKTKRPKGTKLFKDIQKLNQHTKAQESFIPLYSYYVNNMTNINTDSNSKHRQNILALLTKISTLHIAH